ncbi:MAG: hypothetical protein ACREFM_03100, partial [Hypericibacter sp.]
FKPIRNPMQHDLVTKPFEQTDGWVYPPTGPGLGIEVDEAVALAHPWKGSDLHLVPTYRPIDGYGRQ